MLTLGVSKAYCEGGGSTQTGSILPFKIMNRSAVYFFVQDVDLRPGRFLLYLLTGEGQGKGTSG